MDDDTKNGTHIDGDVNAGNTNFGTQHFHGDVYINIPNPNASAIRAETTRSIFISYSRHDREAVQQIYADLSKLGFNLWRDLHDIEGGEPFWEEVKKAIDACESVVLCMSPAALKSEFVQKEWQYARQQGKRVIPIVVGTVDFKTVPRWMSRINWKNFRAGQPERETVWASFIRTLNTPYTGRKVPFMADKLPDYYVNRPLEFENMAAALVNTHGAVAITAAVKGAGGFGKTTLALALCHDLRVRGAFDDGILWVTLGEKPTEADLVRYALDIVTLITGERPAVEGREAVKAELQKAIGDRYMLLVLDDLWRKHDADLFLTDSPNSAVLITTRFDQQLPDATAFRQNVDAMSDAEATNLLTWGIDQDTSQLLPELRALAKRLGRWAVLLRLTSATLRKRIQRGDTLERAISYANKALDRQGLVAFDDASEGQRADAVKSTLEVSLELLDNTTRTHFARLAVFPEDVEIPFSTLEKLWGLDDFDTENTAEALQDAALLAGYDLETHTVRLHDVIRRYLIDEHITDLRDWQAAFADALGDPHMLTNTYEWRNIAYHLCEAGRADTLRGLLLDYAYLQAKLDATDSNALIGDCEYLSEDRLVEIVQSALRLSSHVLNHSPEQLPLQLYARLMSHTDKHPEIIKLLAPCQHQAHPNLFPRTPTFQLAGGPLVRTLAGHTATVRGVSLSGEYAISASRDHTLKVWNWKTGQLIRTLEGHTAPLNHVSLSGEYAVSASDDHTLKVWNWKTGQLIRTLKGHTAFVNSVSLRGKYAISASYDHMLKVWNWKTGQLIRTLEGHTAPLNHVSLSGEYAISASDDHTLKVWNWKTGQLIRTLKGHTAFVNSVSLRGKYAISASRDNTLKVWNWKTGQLICTLEGHTRSVNHVSLSGEYAVSASSDYTLKVWQLLSPAGERREDKCLAKLDRTLEGHTDWVNHVSLSGEYAVSASSDRTLKVWNWKIMGAIAQKGVDTSEVSTLVPSLLEEHKSPVKHVSLSGEYAVSASSDRTLKVWNWKTGQLIRTLEGHTGFVRSVSLRGKYAISASSDRTLKVWNWKTGQLIRTLEGHTAPLNHVSLSGEYAVSASSDRTLKVWNWKTGQLIRTLEGHTFFVRSVSLSGEYAVSASSDRTLKVWNWKTGQLTRTLEGHTDTVWSVYLSGKYVVSASSDRMLKVWNWKTGQLIRTLEGHTSTVRSAYLSGEYAISASLDSTLKMWNWKTGQLIMTFYADAKLWCGVIAEDASIVVAGDSGGNVHFLRPNAALRRLLGVGS